MSYKKIIIILIFSSLFSFSAKAEGECFEKASRGIFKFNQGFDSLILKPIAKGYNKLPESIRNGTGNFTSNLGTLLTIPNYILQGQFRSAGDATASFAINSTIGIFGLANPAEKLGFKVQQEDLGQTLGFYGVKSGCYFVLPILGPTTLMDSIGLIGDSFIDPFTLVTWREKELLNISGSRVDYLTVKGATAVDFRGDNMQNFDNLEKNSIDLYSSIKSVYLQNREKKLNNSLESDDDWGSLDN
jgi:phospholipid-binding lipoprotein MlaA